MGRIEQVNLRPDIAGAASLVLRLFFIILRPCADRREMKNGVEVRDSALKCSYLTYITIVIIILFRLINFKL